MTEKNAYGRTVHYHLLVLIFSPPDQLSRFNPSYLPYVKKNIESIKKRSKELSIIT